MACDSSMYPVLVCLIVTDNAKMYVPKLSRSCAAFVYTLQHSQILYCWEIFSRKSKGLNLIISISDSLSRDTAQCLTS